MLISTYGVTLMAVETDYFKIDKALTDLGLEQVGIARDQLFFEELGSAVDEFKGKIEEMMGGEMPEEIKDLLYAVVERSAHMTGPQLVMSFGDDDEDPAP